MSNPDLHRDQLASGRQDRGYGDKVLLFDVRFAQRVLERRELVAMHAHPTGKEGALRDRKHQVPPARGQHEAALRWLSEVIVQANNLESLISAGSAFAVNAMIGSCK